MAQIESFIQTAWQHLRADRHKQAMDCAKKAHAISPNSPDVAHLLGLLASRDGKPEIALPLLQKAIDTGGRTAHRLRHIAEALLDAGYPEAALSPLNDAIREFGDSSDLLGLKSAIEIALEQWSESAQTAQKAIDINPSLMAWELNLSFSQLMQGKNECGFKNATARPENLKAGSYCPALNYTRPCTLWLNGDQGVGALFFLRYVPLLVKQGWQFHLEADRKLVPILESLNLFLSVKEKNKCPKNEFCVNMGDLPLMALQCGIEEIPPPLTLIPDTKLVEKYKQELAKFGPGPYIAVTWRGGPKGRKHRSGIRALEKVVDPALLGSMLAKTNATIINLQRLPELDESLAFHQALGRKTADYTALNNNLAGMLALLSLVDEYITVSNTNLHLREGLAKPSQVFVNRPFQDWRWQAQGNQSIWYPNSIVYRQEKDKSWSQSLTLLCDVLGKSQPSKNANHAELAAKKKQTLYIEENPSQIKDSINAKHKQIIQQGWDAVAKNIPEAISKAKIVLEENPTNARALHLLGWAAVQDLKFDLAISVLVQATQLEPNNGNIWRDYIRAHVLIDKCAEALNIGNQCLENPNLWAEGMVHFAKGVAHNRLGDDLQALASYERCMMLIPNHIDAMDAAGLIRLRLGNNYARIGFKYCSARSEARTPVFLPYWTCPVLKGNLQGLKVLIVRSMGFGDELSYLRYLPYLINAGVDVTYWCGVKLMPLLARLPHAIKLVPDTEPMPDPVNYDVAFIKNELPIAVEHLGAPEIADPLPLLLDQKKLKHWKEWLNAQGPAPYVGITWRAGVGGTVKDGFGFTRLSKKVEQADFANALTGINATWISLQRNITKDEFNTFENLLGSSIIDIAGLTDDLDDLLCIQYLLHENIGVSNTNMHLRASLGLGSKVLVAYPSTDWRWGNEGTQSVWFKLSKVYRQNAHDGWQTPFSQLRDDLINQYGLAKKKYNKLVNKEQKTTRRNKKIIWVTAGEIKKDDQGYYSLLASAQERVVSIAKLLETKNWKSEFLNESVSELMGGWHDKLPVEGDVVVFSKVFTDHSITLMHDAKARGATVVFDVFNDFANQPQRALHQQKMLAAADLVFSCPELQSKWEQLNQPINMYFENINSELTQDKYVEILDNWLLALDPEKKNETNNTKSSLDNTDDISSKSKILAGITSNSTSPSKRLIWLTAGEVKKENGKPTSDLASTRYRVITPSLALSSIGWQSEIINEGESVNAGGWQKVKPQAGDTLIISKVFTDLTVSLAKDAKRRGAKVILDLCDNFLDHPKRGPLQKALVKVADHVVTSTHTINDALASIGKNADAVISDPVEFKRGEIKFAPQETIKLVWFGHAVNIDTLAQSLPALAKLSQTTPLQLNVVTTLPNGQQDLDKITPKGLTAYYTAWSVIATQAAIADCDIVIIPTLQSEMKNAKSPNRLLEPLWAGRMVVAGRLPAYLQFADSAWVGKSITEGIQWCLANQEAVKARIAQGQTDIEKHFTQEAIGKQWDTLLKQVQQQKQTSPIPIKTEQIKPDNATNNSGVKRISVAVLTTQQPTLPSSAIRLIEPLALLEDYNVKIAGGMNSQRQLSIDYETLLMHDVIIVQRDFPYIDTMPLLKKLKALGKKLVYETDDAFHLIPEYHSKAFHRAKAPAIFEFAQMADVITVSTDYLANEFKAYGKVKVIPNRLSASLWNQELFDLSKLSRGNYSDKKIRIGLIGGANHRDDFNIVKDAIQVIANNHSNVDWVAYGEAANNILKEIPASVVFESHPTNYHYPSHPKRMADLGLDLLLAPLEDTTFNRCISNLKFLESGFLSIPCIMSDVPAFNTSVQNGHNGVLVKNNSSDWINAIQTLINNPSLRQSIGKSARETIKKSFMLSNDSEWLATLKMPELTRPSSRFKSYSKPSNYENMIGLLTTQKAMWPSLNIRINEPLEQLGVKPMVVAKYNETLEIDYSCLFHINTFIVHRDFPSEASMPLLRTLKSKGKKLIYETDDAYHLIPEHHSKAFHRAKAPAIFEFVQMADVVAVSTEPLASEFKACGKVIVIPNMLSQTLWNEALLELAKQNRLKNNINKLRIGIVAGSDHQLDLALLKDAVKAIIKDNPNTEWFAYGDGAVEMLKTFVPSKQLSSIITYLDYFTHPIRLAEMALDIALVPLVDDVFNRCRSNLKFLEFGFLGVPTVFSNVESYNKTVVDGETGLLVKNTTESWVGAIQSLIDNQALREKIGANAQKEVQTNWMLTYQNNGWQALLDKLA